VRAEGQRHRAPVRGHARLRQEAPGRRMVPGAPTAKQGLSVWGLTVPSTPRAPCAEDQSLRAEAAPPLLAASRGLRARTSRRSEPHSKHYSTPINACALATKGAKAGLPQPTRVLSGSPGSGCNSRGLPALHPPPARHLVAHPSRLPARRKLSRQDAESIVLSAAPVALRAAGGNPEPESTQFVAIFSGPPQEPRCLRRVARRRIGAIGQGGMIPSRSRMGLGSALRALLVRLS